MTDCSNSVNADEQQLIKLCLKKPKKWHWELTTSKSSTNISFPTVQLYDENNSTLLAEANEANFTVGSKLCKSASVSKAPSSSSTKRSDSSKSQKVLVSRTHSPITIVEVLDDDNPLIVKHDLKTSFSTADCCYKSNKIFRRYHRSSSSVRSRSSILKRIREFSELACEEDDTSDEDERETRNEIMSRYSSLGSNEASKKKYSMRTCNLGTIIVPKESFSTVPGRRRRRKSIDSEAALEGGESINKKNFVINFEMQKKIASRFLVKMLKEFCHMYLHACVFE